MAGREAGGARAPENEARAAGRDDGLEPLGPAAYVAELLGTFLYVFFICAILSVQNPAGLGYTEFAVIGLVHVLLLLFLVQTLGGTSGAHFNPAITIALAAVRKIRLADAGVYVLLQLAGGIAGALVVKVLLLDEGKGANYGASLVSDKFLQGKPLPALLAETIGAFAVVWAIMGTAVNPRGEGAWAGLVIGGTLGMAVMVLGPLTGGSFNPARSLGPALVSGEFADFWVYVVGPIAGGLIAALGYRALVIAPQDRGGGTRPVDVEP